LILAKKSKAVCIGQPSREKQKVSTHDFEAARLFAGCLATAAASGAAAAKGERLGMLRAAGVRAVIAPAG
jgi:hypothetical protein